MAKADKDEGGWGKLIRDIVVILLLVLGIHSCVAKPFYIPSDSMMQTSPGSCCSTLRRIV